MRHCWNSLIRNDKRHSHLGEACYGYGHGLEMNLPGVCDVWMVKNFFAARFQPNHVADAFHHSDCACPGVCNTNFKYSPVARERFFTTHFAPSPDLSLEQLSSRSTQKLNLLVPHTLTHFTRTWEHFSITRLISGKWMRDTQIDISIDVWRRSFPFAHRLRQEWKIPTFLRIIFEITMQWFRNNFRSMMKSRDGFTAAAASPLQWFCVHWHHRQDIAQTHYSRWR